MSLVNIYVRALNRSYDFKVNEMTEVGQLAEEIVETIAQQERLPLEKNAGLFLLCDPKTARIFALASTLAENGIASGDTLLLV